jgi:DNA-directed RNA polymerase specialized sigma24 family protein
VSFEEFVQACSPRLFRTALLLAGQDRAAAEDLLQLALERAYRHWARVCPSPSAPSAPGFPARS